MAPIAQYRERKTSQIRLHQNQNITHHVNIRQNDLHHLMMSWNQQLPLKYWSYSFPLWRWGAHTLNCIFFFNRSYIHTVQKFEVTKRQIMKMFASRKPMKPVSWVSIQRDSSVYTTRQAYILFFLPFFTQIVACHFIHSSRIETRQPHNLFFSCFAFLAFSHITMHLGVFPNPYIHGSNSLFWLLYSITWAYHECGPMEDTSNLLSFLQTMPLVISPMHRHSQTPHFQKWNCWVKETVHYIKIAKLPSMEVVWFSNPASKA